MPNQDYLIFLNEHDRKQGDILERTTVATVVLQH